MFEWEFSHAPQAYFVGKPEYIFAKAGETYGKPRKAMAAVGMTV